MRNGAVANGNSKVKHVSSTRAALKDTRAQDQGIVTQPNVVVQIFVMFHTMHAGVDASPVKKLLKRHSKHATNMAVVIALQIQYAIMMTSYCIREVLIVRMFLAHGSKWKTLVQYVNMTWTVNLVIASMATANPQTTQITNILRVLTIAKELSESSVEWAKVMMDFNGFRKNNWVA